MEHLEKKYSRQSWMRSEGEIRKLVEQEDLGFRHSVRGDQKLIEVCVKASQMRRIYLKCLAFVLNSCK